MNSQLCLKCARRQQAQFHNDITPVNFIMILLQFCSNLLHWTNSGAVQMGIRSRIGQTTYTVEGVTRSSGVSMGPMAGMLSNLTQEATHCAP